jgi:hypothetical protein
MMAIATIWSIGLAGAACALINPVRGIPDLIAGTYVVPK